MIEEFGFKAFLDFVLEPLIYWLNFQLFGEGFN